MLAQAELDRIKRVHLACSNARPQCPHTLLIEAAQALLRYEQNPGRRFNDKAGRAHDLVAASKKAEGDGDPARALALRKEARAIWTGST